MMARLLALPSGWKGYAIAVAVGVLANLVWSFASTAAMWALGIELVPVVGADLFESWSGLAVIWPLVAVEELIFRVPLAIPAALGSGCCRRRSLRSPSCSASRMAAASRMCWSKAAPASS
jgi:hypothetical protein